MCQERFGLSIEFGYQSNNYNLYPTGGSSRQPASSHGESSTISSHSMKLILQHLQSNSCRKSTNKNYLAIWRRFNKFILKLDHRPDSWEERASLFVAHLFQSGLQSATIKSYISAVKKTLVNDGYAWNDKKILLSSLTGACKLINDRVHTRLPIQIGLLELLLFEIKRSFGDQPFLVALYQAMYALGYYGLFRIGELCKTENADHTIKAKDVHVATNKDKMLIVLYSSKTHGRESHPQKIKITANVKQIEHGYQLGRYSRHFCPFRLMQQYNEIRGNYVSTTEEYFVFRDRTPVTADIAREVLRELLKNLGLNSMLYSVHSLRIGRTSDLAKYNFSIAEIRRAGRWRSNAVYRYIRN